jgi:signal transduction histidine kinase
LLQLLGDIATRFLSTSKAEAVARSAFEMLASQLGLEVYFNFLMEPDGRSLRLSSYAGVEAPVAASVSRLALSQAVCGMVALQRERIVAEAVQASGDPLADLIRTLGIRAYACHPLLAGDRLLGTLSFGTRNRDRFHRNELQLMATVADMAAIAIDRAALTERERRVHRQLEEAHENERRRISRELHDQMGQHLTALAVGLSTLESALPADSQGRLQQLRQIAEEAGREAHHIAVELRPAALDELGLSAALHNYVEEWSDRFRIAADFQASGVDGLAPTSATDVALYRVVQEALNNIAKHARATRASVVLTVEGGSIHLVIEDNGAGFDMRIVMDGPEPASTLGLLGMRERIALCDGTLTIESAPGQGTAVFVRVPVRCGVGEIPDHSEVPPLANRPPAVESEEQRAALRLHSPTQSDESNPRGGAPAGG